MPADFGRVPPTSPNLGGGGEPSEAARAFADCLASFSPSEIELIEVYRRPSEIPADLARENNCAVISSGRNENR
jgi:hypothetical protein